MSTQTPKGSLTRSRYDWNVERMMWGSVQLQAGASSDAVITLFNDDKLGRYLALYGFSAYAAYPGALLVAKMDQSNFGTVVVGTTVQPLKPDGQTQPGQILSGSVGGGQNEQGAFVFIANGQLMYNQGGAPWALIPPGWQFRIMPFFNIPTQWWNAAACWVSFIWSLY